ncbi:MAG TPA: glutaredoxin family protein [Patescibacteria group bacterium]|nr:glutaredoxin family protein [Patescibacteria group bacterium]
MGPDKPVRMYTISTCGHCKAAKRFMREHNIPHEFTDVDLLEREEKRAVLQELRRLNERLSYPTIIIGDRVIVGYREEELKEALGLS